MNDSATITFTQEEEIKNTDESVDEFVERLVHISESHSFIKQLSAREYSADDIVKAIVARCQNISESIDIGAVLNQSRDNISKRILSDLSDLCQSTLILNGLLHYQPIGLRAAWEIASLNIDTKFLSTFLQGLRYIGLRVPEDGQYERLMLKYYDFLWKIRKYLKDYHQLVVFGNLEKFPLQLNEEDQEYNKLVAASIETVTNPHNPWKNSRYYVQKKTSFYVDSERYFEITLQLAGKYAIKFNRLTVYSKMDISSNYSIQLSRLTRHFTPTNIQGSFPCFCICRKQFSLRIPSFATSRIVRIRGKFVFSSVIRPPASAAVQPFGQLP